MAKARTLWRRAWPICMGVTMALREIPEAAFQAAAADEEEAREAREIYEAYRNLDRSC